MNAQIVLSLADIGKIALWAALLIILIYFIVILRKIYLSIVDLTNVLKDNKLSIDQTLETLPGITRNVERITNEVASGAESIHGFIGKAAKVKDRFKSDETEK